MGKLLNKVMEMSGEKRVQKKTNFKVENYSFLKKYLPTCENDENFALLTHYLLQKNSDIGEKYKEQLLKNGCSEENLKNAEDDEFLKNIKFCHKENSSFTFIDLFAGIGGFRLALQNCGGECVFSSEWDDAAKQTYFENYGEVPFGDISIGWI